MEATDKASLERLADSLYEQILILAKRWDEVQQRLDKPAKLEVRIR